ncbi:MAG: RNA polymerase sigma-70 factor [Bacteroidota bacterium]
MDEQELILSLREGSEEAFEAVLKKHFAKLCLYAEHFVREKHVARDIVEDFFCDMWLNSACIKIESNLTGYLYRSVHNRCLKYLRHQKVRQKYIESQQYIFTDREILEPVSDDVPEAVLIQQELETRISEAIESLPAECRRIFSLNRFENLSYLEIAEKLGISVNTVKTQMTRALHKLREKLKDYLVM